jgi:hypothetical protein
MQLRLPPRHLWQGDTAAADLIVVCFDALRDVYNVLDAQGVQVKLHSECLDHVPAQALLSTAEGKRREGCCISNGSCTNISHSHLKDLQEHHDCRFFKVLKGAGLSLF